MIAHVLCPVDFSEFSARALRYAAAFAAWYGAQLSVMWVRSRGLTGRRGAEHEGDLEHFTTTVLGPGTWQLIAAEGAVVPEILRAGRDADLIVMGTHGAGGPGSLQRLLVGSVTEKVLRKAPCPVLTIPRLAALPPPTPFVPEVVLCAVDFSPSSTRAFRDALALAAKAHGQLLLLHALEWFEEEEEEKGRPRFPTSEEDARAQLDELVPEEARSQCSQEVLIGYGNPAREILRVASERQASMIVLGIQGRGAIDLTLFGSTAQQVVREASCPVLTVGPQSPSH